MGGWENATWLWIQGPHPRRYGITSGLWGRGWVRQQGEAPIPDRAVAGGWCEGETDSNLPGPGDWPVGCPDSALDLPGRAQLNPVSEETCGPPTVTP